jgi:hypothetical protein
MTFSKDFDVFVVVVEEALCNCVFLKSVFFLSVTFEHLDILFTSWRFSGMCN